MKNSDINRVFKRGNTIAGNFIFLRSAKNNLGLSRFAFIVGFKVSRKAVIRNKIKRNLREVVRKNLSQIKSGLDFLIIAKPSIINKNSKEIETEMKKLFLK